MNRERLGDQNGFTLIELLVVILIVGILAAIGIPSFLNQKGKADDAAAKTLVHTAQTALEAYQTDHSGSYAGATPSDLNAIEPSINYTNPAEAELTGVSTTSNAYTLTVQAARTSDMFTVINQAGTFSHTCTGNGGGCPNGTW
jgi:type IV pilus assembly protein PilA